jgi:predicted unusual protein kinase regulating ubiquinone biosynthesis (AarF/ABC1/UbiB family)
VVADFADNLAEELDFPLEAQSMDAWVSHLHPSPLGENIRVAQVYWDLTSQRVLTKERIPGHPHRRRRHHRNKGSTASSWSRRCCSACSRAGCGTACSRRPARRILYVDDDGKIVFFDFGIMGRIDPRTVGCCGIGVRDAGSRRTTRRPARSSC